MKMRVVENFKDIKSLLQNLRDSEVKLHTQSGPLKNLKSIIFKVNETDETFCTKSDYESQFQEKEMVIFRDESEMTFTAKLKEVKANYLVYYFPEGYQMPDTREYYRQEFRDKTKVIMIKNSKGALIKCKAFDISQGGLGLIGIEGIDGNLVKDENVVIVSIGTSRALNTPARVAFIKGVGAGNTRSFRIGLEVPKNYLLDEGIVSYFATQEALNKAKN